MKFVVRTEFTPNEHPVQEDHEFATLEEAKEFYDSYDMKLIEYIELLTIHESKWN